MHTTSPSLLCRLRQPGDEAAWRRFAELYTPLLYYWARRLGLQPADAADLVQEVFAALVRKLPRFTYDRHRSFRSWLRAVTHNKWRDLCNRRTERPLPPGSPALQALPAADGGEGVTGAEYRRLLLRQALRIMRTDFRPLTWQACWMYAVEGRPAEEVAAALGVGVAAVYVAKSRVLARLRQELEGLLD
jgi:RNA polymerase sigma-70 factor (ECF subfamily)